MPDIERVEAGDAALLAPLLADAFDSDYYEAWTVDQCAAMLIVPGSFCLAMRDAGKAVRGFALVRYVLDEAELALLAVDSGCRRENIGRRLIDRVIDELRGKAVHRLFLEVRENNSARIFYERMGFVLSGRRRDYYRARNGTRVDALTLEQMI